MARRDVIDVEAVRTAALTVARKGDDADTRAALEHIGCGRYHLLFDLAWACEQLDQAEALAVADDVLGGGC